MGETRRAVVVGINEYDDDKIENLSGAVNDATEIYNVLKDNGGFIIRDNHFLLDQRATGENIRQAISDLFWATEECDIALFYFSGHGRGHDHFKHGYLLPRDVNFSAPFVRGIRIQELKELFLYAQPKTAILILDCCYSGIATGVERGSPDDEKYIKRFHEEMRLEEGKGVGRFILASADADKTAREEERQHALEGEKHFHGLFSFQLIEALRVGPAGPKDEFSRVSLGALVEHLETVFKDDPKHTPQLNVGAASGVYDIFIATIEAELQKRLQEHLYEVKTLLNLGRPIGLMTAIGKLQALEKQGLECEEIEEFYDQIDNIIDPMKGLLLNWWRSNQEEILLQTLKGGASARSKWYDLLERMMRNFDLSTIRNLDRRSRGFLSSVIEAVAKQDPNEGIKRIVNEVRLLDRDSGVVVQAETIGSDSVAPIVTSDVAALPPPGPISEVLGHVG